MNMHQNGPPGGGGYPGPAHPGYGPAQPFGAQGQAPAYGQQPQHGQYPQQAQYPQHGQHPQHGQYPQHAHPAQPRARKSSSLAIVLVIGAIGLAVLGALGVAGIYMWSSESSSSDLFSYQSVAAVPGLKIPGGGVRNPSAKKDDISYTYGKATEGYTGSFVTALRGAVTSEGWRFERNTSFSDSVVFDCTRNGRRVGALITKDSDGRILLTLMPTD